MAKFSLMLARFPFQNQECPDVTDWFTRTVLKAKADSRVSEVLFTRVDDTPITMGRNRVVEDCLKRGIDYLLMVDSDMKPDLAVPGAKPFWDSSWEFVMGHQQTPCVVGAPYCGPPPCNNVYIFRWAQWANAAQKDAAADFRLDQYTREDAAVRVGFEQVAALPTGLILIDMRAVRQVQPPWFYYEWKSNAESEKASTEDVTFTRDLSLLGFPQYVNWDAWAGHWKRICVGKPEPLYVDNIREKYRKAVADGIRSDERLRVMSQGPKPPPPVNLLRPPQATRGQGAAAPLKVNCIAQAMPAPAEMQPDGFAVHDSEE